MSTTDLAAAIGRRRTFAIISHPDAGKTTLTEKLLLYGGAIVCASDSPRAGRGVRPCDRHADDHRHRHERERGARPSLNGTPTPAPRVLTAGKTYRLRVINLLPAAPANVALTAADSSAERWNLISKDGAALLRPVTRAARVRIGVGEAYDFTWTPSAGGKILSARFAADPSAPAAVIHQRFTVRP